MPQLEITITDNLESVLFTGFKKRKIRISEILLMAAHETNLTYNDTYRKYFQTQEEFDIARNRFFNDTRNQWKKSGFCYHLRHYDIKIFISCYISVQLHDNKPKGETMICTYLLQNGIVNACGPQFLVNL